LSVIDSKNNIQRLFSLGTILKTAGTYQDTNNQTSHKDKYSLDDETHVNLTRELISTSAVYFYLLGTAGDSHALTVQMYKIGLSAATSSARVSGR
jgi:hypothetical protein